ncbi:YciI family protein [Actinocorallia sp. A-T 12471]|uniref:YciI family protein n=1 Tax=Actinocorallia sp. A-T 12471 TaxID=3089813 RepID=UPI0029D3B6B8|nr:YciI family protein [Actinocorallia sp. A-T 12471]MDX6740905.1 YciI family protein [Actinocorallia sp. A-T 12471]
MKYLITMYGNKAKWDSVPADTWPQIVAAQDAFNRRYMESGELLGAFGLADATDVRTVQVIDGVAKVGEGTVLGNSEYMATFYLLDVENEERALEIAADMPIAVQDPVELWPIHHEAPGSCG